jgi:lipopolysaccharide/colanic/teichoic acid biosynthesis glycosyltransferase
LKRALDVALSAFLLIVLSPILLLLALAIRIDSPGPALFWQIRIGREKRPFTIVKFRTMADRGNRVIDQLAEPVVGTASAMRVTRVGSLLRRLSLDELPQLWNVLLGEMSLVGPRPIIPEQLLAIPEEYEIRFAVRPGLTGLSQVRGRRRLDWMDQLKTDVEYVRTRSAGLDLRIILLTAGVVFSGDGVYDPHAKNGRNYLRGGGKS